MILLFLDVSLGKLLIKFSGIFFRPGAGSDIKRYCRSCQGSQKSTPRGKIQKAPLVLIPIIIEPFSRVAIDLVGPLIPSERGHKYILTATDCATRFPEAVPLWQKISSISFLELAYRKRYYPIEELNSNLI